MNEDDLQREISQLVNLSGASPLLFVGSGLPRRYLKTPGWEALLEIFAQRLGHPLAYYKARAEGNLPMTASEISLPYFDRWWSHEDHVEEVTAFGELVTSKADPLKISISQLFENATLDFEPDEHELAEELSALAAMKVDAIITTNYDLFLEALFPQFNVFIGQEQLLFARVQGIAEIYKIHGCVTDPHSLVLTGDDYDSFNERNPYLAAKLLSMFVEHPVVFVGYGLGDENVLEILNSITSCLSSEHVEKLRDHLIFVEWVEDLREPELGRRDLQVGDKLLPIVGIRTSSLMPVYRGLGQIERRVPAALLRAIKEHIYELVRTDDPTHSIVALDFEEGQHLDGRDVILGVGVKSQLKAVDDRFSYGPQVTKDDILDEYINEPGKLDPAKLLTLRLPAFNAAASVPYFRFLAEAGYSVDHNGAWDPEDPPSEVLAALASTSERMCPSDGYLTYRKHAEEKLVKTGTSFAELVQQGDGRALYYGWLLPQDRFEPDHLHDFLKSRWNRQKEEGGLNALHLQGLARLVCLHDFMVHAPVVGFELPEPAASEDADADEGGSNPAVA